MSAAKRTKKVMPLLGTREQAIDFLRDDLKERSKPFIDRMESSSIKLRDYLHTSNLVGTAMSAASLFSHSLMVISPIILSGNFQAWAVLQRYFSYMKWSVDLQAHQFDQINLDYASQGSMDDHALTFFYLLAHSASGVEWAKPSARMLYNVLASEGFHSVWDRASPFEDFLYRLVVMDLKNEWIDPLSEDWGGKDLGGFRRLLGAVGSKDFEEALVEYCDFRLARAQGYASLQAQRPSPANRESTFEFEGYFFALFPLELLVLKAVYEKTTHKPLSLEADHPLLHLPTMNIPESFILIEDDITKAMQALGEREFGDNWKPGSAPQIHKS